MLRNSASLQYDESRDYYYYYVILKFLIFFHRLIYTEAVLMEIIRLSNVPPLGIAHRAIKTTTIGGKTIPKGAIVLTNLYGLHMDETYWKSSNEFIPERFINEDGKIKSHDKHYLPFGYGKFLFT